MNVLSPPSPNNVAPYYLQVYTSSVNDLILSLAIFTPTFRIYIVPIIIPVGSGLVFVSFNQH
jgi:hypothetical protein